MPPSSSNSNYDFILKDPNQPKKRFGLPSIRPSHVSGISIVSLVVVVFILFAVLVFGGSSSANKPLVDILDRAQEIKRVSVLAASQTNADQDTKDLAATVQNSLLSQQSQIIVYLKTVNTRAPDLLKETTYLNNSTDSDLQKAAQNGNLSQYYQAYLKTNLTSYETALQTTYKIAVIKAKPLLAGAYTSTKTITNQL